jgi:hypothetical protein
VFDKWLGWAHVCVIAEPRVLRGRRFGNLVVAAASRELPVAGLIRRVAAGPFPARLWSQHGHRRLAQVELGPVILVIAGGDDDHDGRRWLSHVTSPAYLGQLAKLLAVGEEDEVPRLPVL